MDLCKLCGEGLMGKHKNALRQESIIVLLGGDTLSLGTPFFGTVLVMDRHSSSGDTQVF